MSSFPSSEDYIRAVQTPAQVFTTPSLRAAAFALHPIFQIPMPASGTSAVVFRARVDGTDRALRFFIRDDASSRPRYDALERYFTGHGLTGSVANPTWVDQAISVNSGRWPVVQMDWVNGRTLDAYIAFLAEGRSTAALRTLADAWLSLLFRLQSVQFAHGDLQHGNVMMDESARLRLVDFDGSWIPELDTSAPTGETGHQNYQLPGRPWGRWMDTFPGLLIYTALIALAKDPSLWSKLSTSENILFTRGDLRPQFDTRVWTELAALHDDEVDRLGVLLRRCCESPRTADGPLDELLGRPAKRSEDTEPERPLGRPHTFGQDAATEPTGDEPWWIAVQRESLPALSRTAEPVGAMRGSLQGAPHRPEPSPSPDADLPAPPSTPGADPAVPVRKQSEGRDAAIATAIACALALIVGMVVGSANRSSNQGVLAGLITVGLTFAVAYTLLRKKR